jgi:hypothetical protein
MENTAPDLSLADAATQLDAQLTTLGAQTSQVLRTMTDALLQAITTFEMPTDFAGITKAARALITLDRLVKQLYAPPRAAKVKTSVERIERHEEKTDAEPEPIVSHPFTDIQPPRNRHEARRMAKTMVQVMKKVASG